MSVRDWINTLNVVSFASVNNQVVYFIVVVGFSVIAAIGMLRNQSWGIDLAKFILGTAIVKSTVTLGSRIAKRLTDKGYVEAKGHAQAEANAGKVTVQNVEQVTVTEEPKREQPIL